MQKAGGNQGGKAKTLGGQHLTTFFLEKLMPNTASSWTYSCNQLMWPL